MFFTFFGDCGYCSNGPNVSPYFSILTRNSNKTSLPKNFAVLSSTSLHGETCSLARGTTESSDWCRPQVMRWSALHLLFAVHTESSFPVIFWLGTWSRIVSAAVIQAIFKCPFPFGTFPDPVSCESYWICNNGQSIAATCNFGLIVSCKKT